jgi:ADP-ribosylglycohydrolase
MEAVGWVGVDDRARGALYGLAIGDALGMPTRQLSRVEVIQRWGGVLGGFEAAPPGGAADPGLPAGSVTDDTGQTLLLARLLVDGQGEIDPRQWALALASWEQDLAARGCLGLLGPSTSRALAAVRAGVPPAEAGRHGDTNGAAMRATPVGVAFPVGRALLEHVRQASLLTHNTPVAMAGAAAVAAAVSAGIEGDGPPGAVASAISAARLAADGAAQAAPAGSAPLVTPVARDAIVGARIEWVADEVRGSAALEAADFIVEWVGTSLATHESVPAAFAVLTALPDDPWQACLLAASLGGDSGAIAAMAGAMAGACHGLSAFPEHAIAMIDGHGLQLPALADSLLAVRAQAA